MTETLNHYPEIIRDSHQMMEIFPHLEFSELKEFFLSHYDFSGMDERKILNSLRLGFFKGNDFSSGLSYSWDQGGIESPSFII